MEAGLEVKLAATLLEKVLERFSQQIHHHDVIVFTGLSLFITHEMEVRDVSFAT